MIPKKPAPDLIRGGFPDFGKRSCSAKRLERDDDSKKGHPALAALPARAAAKQATSKGIEFGPALLSARQERPRCIREPVPCPPYPTASPSPPSPARSPRPPPRSCSNART